MLTGGKRGLDRINTLDSIGVFKLNPQLFAGGDGNLICSVPAPP